MAVGLGCGKDEGVDDNGAEDSNEGPISISLISIVF